MISTGFYLSVCLPVCPSACISYAVQHFHKGPRLLMSGHQAGFQVDRACHLHLVPVCLRLSVCLCAHFQLLHCAPVPQVRACQRQCTKPSSKLVIHPSFSSGAYLSVCPSVCVLTSRFFTALCPTSVPVRLSVCLSVCPSVCVLRSSCFTAPVPQVRACRRQCIESAPNMLMVCLKRYTGSGMFSKISKRVSVVQKAF